MPVVHQDGIWHYEGLFAGTHDASVKSRRVGYYPITTNMTKLSELEEMRLS